MLKNIFFASLLFVGQNTLLAEESLLQKCALLNREFEMCKKEEMDNCNPLLERTLFCYAGAPNVLTDPEDLKNALSALVGVNFSGTNIEKEEYVFFEELYQKILNGHEDALLKATKIAPGVPKPAKPKVPVSSKKLKLELKKAQPKPIP